MKKTKILLLIILLIASFLRLWKLNEVPVSMFGDELEVGYQAYSIIKTGNDYYGNFMPLQFHSLAEYRTPLYLYSSVPTVALFGITPWGVRLPAALFGILGVWGLYLLVTELLSYLVKNQESRIKNQGETIALLAAFVLAISPWHIQYSRAGFEVTEMLVFFIFGLYFFFRALHEDGRCLWLSAIFLVTTPLIYSTAKLFAPLLLLFLIIVWFKQLIRLPKKSLILTSLFLILFGLPTVYSTFFGGGTQRFNYISVFSDPTIEPEVGTGRLADALSRGGVVAGLQPTTSDKLFHNKFVFYIDRISTNYFQALSSDFLFNEGDPNLRHSIKGVGQFYKVEFFALILGLILFFGANGMAAKNGDFARIRWFIAFWILVGVIPSAFTRDGGNHATRLILILPPLIFLVAYGLVESYKLLPKLYKPLFFILYSCFLLLNFIFYQHNFWVHNPYDSEHWWHAGWQESIQTIKQIDKDYDRVIITMSDEPAWIFFASWYEYDPAKWQAHFPTEQKAMITGWGEMSYTDKYYFGSFHPASGGIYDLPKYIDNKTLYLASAKEIGANLITEPQRVPTGLQLIKAIAYPSGEPAFYLFTHN
jgi:hypothetical protein